MFKEKLKNLRLNNKLTQNEMAEMLKTSRSTYNNYERGNAEPNIPTLIKLADYFHTTIDSLVGHDVPYLLDRGLLNKQQNYIIDKIKNLSPQDCERVEAFIAGLEEGKRQQDYIRNQFKGDNQW